MHVRRHSLGFLIYILTSTKNLAELCPPPPQINLKQLVNLLRLSPLCLITTYLKTAGGVPLTS